jgi:hypothetical protein
MRNTLIGVAAAAVLIAALFAASHYGRKPAAGGSSGADAEQAAAALKDDWIGETRIGAWKLVCNEAKELPKAPSNGMTGNSQGTPPKEGPPPGWKLPRCIVGLVLHNPSDPKDEIRVTFRTIGFKRVLSLFMRFPPSDVSPGDTVTARFDALEMAMPVRSCPAAFCLAIQSIKLAEASAVEDAKKFTVAFTPTGSDAAVILPLPTEGLGPAIRAMRRLNH